MSIEIYNNSMATNIYPVLSTGTSGQDQWMLAWCEVPEASAGGLFFRPNQFRFYVKPTGDGIPPGGSVEISLPLLTQLQDTIDGTTPDQVIDWWGGGRIEIFDSPADSNQPPAALTAAYSSRPGQKPIPTPVAGTPVPRCYASFADSCGADDQDLEFFVDPAGFGHDEPAQLIEYTLGALKQNKDPIELVTNNVDYDVSYADTAYLPAAMEPVNNSQVGYIGTIQTIDHFRDGLVAFLDDDPRFQGWPVFLDAETKQPILKVPSALNIFGETPESVLSPGPWPPIETMKDNFDACIQTSVSGDFCDNIRAVNTLIERNYQSYLDKYGDAGFGCNQNLDPIELTEEVRLRHVYGWTPFTENCTSATYNLLEDTPGYADHDMAAYREVKEKFDALQYWEDGQDGKWDNPTEDGKFDPYVMLIHAPQFLELAVHEPQVARPVTMSR